MQKINNNLVLGVSLGAAIVSLIGFLIMTVAYFEKSKELTNALDGREKAKKEAVEAVDDNNVAPVNKDVAVNKDDWSRGDKNAPITIVEFSDFQCPYCARFHATMQEVINKNKNVRWVYKHFPLPSHSLARKASLASECAGEQGKFWEFTDDLYANQGSISDAYFSELASGLKLNVNKFDTCLTSEKYADKVDGDQKAGQNAGVSATPTSYANGQQIMGALPYTDVKNIIDNLK